MGLIFKVPAFIIYFVGGIWSFFLCMGVVADALGFLGAILMLILGPIGLAVVPWYEALANSNWFLVILSYGCGIVATILVAIGIFIDGDY